MDQTAYIYMFVVIGIIACSGGIFFLKNPNPRYVPKLSYQYIISKTDEEGAVKIAQFYGGVSLLVGVVLLIYSAYLYLGG
ncbi:MAG: hypothetical protein HXS44_06580 [Theionarchaea archaeon]|nr:hypothetical protein [Theionarchaea archaeon]